MNRTLWIETLSEKYSPAWPCPTCHNGTLAIVPGSLVYKETVWSKHARRSDDWEPEWPTYVFTAWVKCGRSSCGEEVVVAGDGNVEHWCNEEESGSENCFRPLFCLPMPDIFELPRKCPAEVASELRAAFALFWSDHSAAANHVRIALERLMDHLRIPKRRKNEKGKFCRLDLHKRIEEFRKTEPVIADQLMALKWLGNTGSHKGSVMRDDVLDAFEILEHSLFELVEQRTRRLAALALGLTEKHHPGARKRKVPF